jgi:hypothetical protein
VGPQRRGPADPCQQWHAATGSSYVPVQTQPNSERFSNPPSLSRRDRIELVYSVLSASTGSTAAA